MCLTLSHRKCWSANPPPRVGISGVSGSILVWRLVERTELLRLVGNKAGGDGWADRSEATVETQNQKTELDGLANHGPSHRGNTG